MRNKKILIVNNNLHIGGIQKALINFLKNIKSEYDVTLLLFAKSGPLISEIPSGVNVIYSSWFFRVLGMPWSELKKNPFLVLMKFIIIIMNKIFRKKFTIKFLSLFQKKLIGYDYSISYSHATNEKNMSICCPEFVLFNTSDTCKICFIHCDYPNSGTASNYNNYLYKNFNKIICVSDSVKKKFLSVVPNLISKTYSLRNFQDESIVEFAEEDTFIYDSSYINLVSISRLSKEKGIDLAINALYLSNRTDIRYYIVGDGPEMDNLKSILDDFKMGNVFLLGESKNPYKYMKNADYLLVPSLHEAAPMVFDEASILGLRIISTNTTSAKEMLTEYDTIIGDVDKTLFTKLTRKGYKPVVEGANNKILIEFINILES